MTPWRPSSDSTPTTSGRRTPTCCSPPSHRKLDDPEPPSGPPSNRSSPATPAPARALLRLIELDEADEDWEAPRRSRPPTARRQPADPGPAPRARPRRRAARARSTRRSPPIGPSPCSTTTDPAGVHYRLATLLQPRGRAGRGPPRGPEGAGGGPAVPRGPSAPAGARRARSPAAEEPTPSADDRTMTRRRRAIAALPDRRRRRWSPLAVVRGPGRLASRPSARPGYGGRGYRGGLRTGGMPVDRRRGVPDWEIDERFPKDVFTFVRVQYDSGGGYGGGTAAGAALGDRLPRQRPELLVPAPAIDLAEGRPRPGRPPPDRRTAVRLPVPLPDRARRACSSPRPRSPPSAATCSTAAS